MAVVTINQICVNPPHDNLFITIAFRHVRMRNKDIVGRRMAHVVDYFKGVCKTITLYQ